MAMYEYRCRACDHTFARLERAGEHGKTRVTCPACKSADIERLYSPFYAKTIRKS